MKIQDKRTDRMNIGRIEQIAETDNYDHSEGRCWRGRQLLSRFWAIRSKGCYLATFTPMLVVGFFEEMNLKTRINDINFPEVSDRAILRLLIKNAK